MMNADTLRASILQAAIEGKLVPQLESEPKVERIGKAPEIIPFKIPRKWEWTTIGESLLYGSTEQIMGQHIPKDAWVLDLEDIEKNSGRLLIKKRGLPGKSNKAKFKKGDVLYGKLRPYLNKCIIADEDGFSTTEIVAVRPKEGSFKFDSGFLKIFLMSPFFVGYANRVSYGVKMPRLGTKDAKSALIPVPPLKEQRRIVARLNKLLPLVEEYGEVQNTMEIAQRRFPDQLKASLLQAAIQGKLVPQLESEPEVEQIGEAPENTPFKIPKKWKWEKLGNYVSVISGTSYKPSDVTSKGIRIIRGGNVNNFKITFKPDDVFLPKSFFDEKLTVKSTDIVIVASTGSLEVIGKPGIVSKDAFGRCQIGAFLRIIRPKLPDFSQYLRIIFMSDFYRNRIRGLVKGTNIRNIKKEYINEMYIPVPPLREQQRIVAKLNKLLPFIDQMET